MTEYRALLDRDDIDVVDVAVPTYLHFEVGRAALESGKHLFVEKPMATTVDQCRQLNALAAQNERLLAVGFKRRVAHLWRKVKELVDDGVAGTPQYAVFELWRWPYRQGSEGWRYDIRRVGSWVLEEPVHCFDKARWYFAELGEPISVYACANSNQQDHPELQDNFNAMMRFPRGGHVVITQSLCAWGHHHGLKLTGTEGAIRATWTGARDSDLQPVSSLEYVRGEDVCEVQLPPATGELYELEQEMAMMVRAVRDGQPIEASGQDGLWSVALCEAAQKSIDTGEVISVEGFRP
jgi:myo-inositol 2-dehydrogenase/D-chiro-inositol 1-dehydrogenase